MTQQLVQQIHALDEDQQIQVLQQTLEGITLGTCVKLVKHLEEAWDVEATPSGGGISSVIVEEEEEEEQSEFQVLVTAVGPKKIGVIKTIRRLTQKDLKASKAVLDQLPGVVHEKLPKDEAERYKKDLEEAGATVELK